MIGSTSRRSREAVEEFLGDVRPQVWVADRYGAQAGWAERRQACLAHLLRDTQYIIDQGDGVFAPALRRFIGEACDEAEQRERWNDATLDLQRRRLEAELDRVLALIPTHPAVVKWKGTIEKLRPNLLVFMSNRDVPATNTESERSLRPSATYRKITNGFRSQWGAIEHADIRSTIEPARRRSTGALQAIRDASPTRGEQLPRKWRRKSLKTLIPCSEMARPRKPRRAGRRARRNGRADGPAGEPAQRARSHPPASFSRQ